tara:strand:+ start:662 stop:772 length:111 start_codon:yes stop_codon:yes gene_type:complete
MMLYQLKILPHLHHLMIQTLIPMYSLQHRPLQQQGN